MTTYLTTHGYRKVIVGHDHPMADRKGECYEHRLVASEKLGRILERSEIVHHIDRDKLNNDPSNLHVCASQREHGIHHHEVSDEEIRELIVVHGLRTRQLRARGIGNTHRVARIYRELRAEGHNIPSRERRISHCANGHELTEVTLYVDPHGKRCCRICRQKSRSLYEQRARDEQVAT